MKRAIIVHCWEGYPEFGWYPRAKKELEAKGFSVLVPEFPETDAPKKYLWVPYLAEKIGKPDEDLYLIGHSVGCITILRYLEKLKSGEKIGGVVLVAGYTDDLGFEELESFFQTPIDFENIKNKASNGFVAIHSDNDPYVPLKHTDIFKEKLGAEIIIKHNMGHFSDPANEDDLCLELPEVVDSVLKMSK